MESFVNELRNSRLSRASAYTDFLLSYKHDQSTVHAFVEGSEDESFYRNYLESQKPNQCILAMHRCNNKSDVYHNHSLINFARYEKHRILFFVDKDLSDFLSESYSSDTNIYVTKYYSIENYLVTLNMLERVLREVLNQSDQEIINAFRSTFEKQYKRFCDQMINVMAWIILVKKLGLKANVNNINLDRLFSLGDDLSLSRNHDCIKLPQLYGRLSTASSVKVSSAQLKQLPSEKKNLKDCSDSKRFIRGKFDMWFFLAFLKKVKAQLEQRRTPGSRRISNLPSLSEAVNILGPRHNHDTELVEFIQTNWRSLTPFSTDVTPDAQ